MRSEAIRVEVLGPLRVHDAAGRDLAPNGVLQRRLLALLVLRRGHVVSADSAVEVLWPVDLPSEPVAALQNHVNRLRRRLPTGMIESSGSGYRLDAARVEVDADRVVSLLAEPVPGAAELRTILARWQGPAYPELDDVDAAIVESVRLDELRQRVCEAVAEARLAVGDLDGLVADLLALVDSEPLRERPRALLMSAFAATGRHVEALRAFDEFRRLLGDELGTEPSPELVAQHQALLTGVDGARRTTRTRLPIPMTPLVGRDAIVAELVARVDAGRLVTILGPGGVGKTRLLIEVGHRLGATRPDRQVVWCELVQADAGSVIGVLGAALGIDDRPGTSLADRIVSVLGDDELVVLLDNCEHVLDSTAAIVADLLAGCPHLRIVATSRERLRLAGEQVWPVPPLPADDAASPAVELFVQRATAAAPDFEPDARARAAIVEIVHRLDGLPLAIELAAARLHSLDLADVAAGLDRRFELLSTGYRSATRHASLAAAVAWSFDSLDPAMQRCFAALSVLARPFTADDAAAVCGLDETAAVELLSGLAERSLVRRTRDRRYAMLETLRAFGAEQLASSDRSDAVSDRHSRWMVEWVEGAARGLARPGRPVLREIDDAVPELRTALAWLVDHDLLEPAARLVVGLVDYGFLRVRPDVLGWADLVLAADPDDRSGLTPALLGASAYAAWMGGDVDASARLVERALRVEQEQPGDRRVPRLRIVRGNIDLFEGRLAEAAGWYQQAIDAASDDAAERLFARATLLLAWGYAGDARAVELADQLLAEVGTEATAHTAYAWYCAGEADLAVDTDRALARLTTAIELAEVTNASFVRGLAGASKASIEARSGDPAVAIADYRWLIEHWRRAGMWSTQWTMLRSVATLLARIGRPGDAAVLEGAVRSTAAGHRIFGADAAALDELGARLRAALGDGPYEAALAEGRHLDGAAAVERALHAL